MRAPSSRRPRRSAAVVGKRNADPPALTTIECGVEFLQQPSRQQLPPSPLSLRPALQQSTVRRSRVTSLTTTTKSLSRRGSEAVLSPIGSEEQLPQPLRAAHHHSLGQVARATCLARRIRTPLPDKDQAIQPTLPPVHITASTPYRQPTGPLSVTPRT